VEQDRASANSAEALMRSISELLHGEIARFNWVGFYLISKTDPEVLVLGPFTGSFTPVDRIPLHQGLCGTAASTGKSVVVNDVSSDPRYLSASALVKSEMVSPIVVKGKVVAEIDVNSYFSATFGRDEQDLVEACAAAVAQRMEQPGQVG
jgi:GAF domain-containing protein